MMHLVGNKVMTASSNSRPLIAVGAVVVVLVALGLTYSASTSGLPSLARRPRPVPLGTGTDPNDAGRSAAIALPPQGLYESCLPSESECLARLTEMGARGFRIVLNDGLRWESSASDIRAYADHAHELGMKVILPVKYSPEWDSDERYLVKDVP